MQLSNKNIVFFDGVCNLCNGFVDFLLEVDKKEVLHFSSLQSETALKLLGEIEMNTVIFYKEGELFYKSDAVIELLITTNRFLNFLRIFKIIPKFIRDSIYMSISRARYRLFGKRETCRLPSQSEEKRFL